MIKSYFAKRAAKKAAMATVQKEILVVCIMGLTALVRIGLEKLQKKFPEWKFLRYRRYVGL